MHLSIVTPAYKCAACIPELHRRLSAALPEITDDYEILFVDDGSPENDWEIIAGICATDPKVRGIKLSRNFGQHYAITAGLDHVRGDWVVVMDCDLQDRPEEIPKLYAKAKEGYDIAFARRVTRSDSLFRKHASKMFVRLYNWIGDIDFDDGIANFSISSRQVIESVTRYRERNRSFPVFLLDVGYRRTTVNVDHGTRHAGRSAYTFGRLFDFAIQNIVARSNKPLRLSIRFGFLLAGLSLLYGSFTMVRYFTHDITVPGWTTLAVLVSFLGGLGFANLGILGLYLGKVFDEVKHRPLYFVHTRLNDPKNNETSIVSAANPTHSHA